MIAWKLKLILLLIKKKKIVSIISDKDNYKSSAWREIESDEAKIDSQDKAIAILKLLKQAYNGIDEISINYNKGYQKPGTTVWNDVLTNCETPQSKVLTIDQRSVGGAELLDALEIYFLADVTRDSNLNPYKIFKKVIVKKLENKVLATIHDEKSVVYRIINDEGIKETETLGGGMKKFAYNIEVVGGMIPFTNSWALVSK